MPFAFLLGLLVSWPRLSAVSPSTDFDTEAAMAGIRAWSAEPRPAGSVAQARVVDDLERRLTAAGFVVTREPFGAGLVNLVASAPGAGEDGVWLVAHTDSVRAAPGAGDDGLGLAATVGAATALGPHPRLHVLLTDGEERGLLGARAFVGRHQGERLVINVEARGDRGPAYMFQTAGPVMDAWADAGCGAQTTSLARTVYDLLPNDTDFTVFRAAGDWGYDFALIGGAEHYHMPTDTADNLDPRSVQQVGRCVTALARTWLDLPRPADAPTPVWFQLLGLTLVLPTMPIRALGLLGVLLARPTLRGVGAWVGAVVLAGAVGLGAELVIWRTAVFHAGIAEMPGAGAVYAGALVVAAGAPWLLLRRADRATVDGFVRMGAGVASLVALLWPGVGYALLPGVLAALAPSRVLRWAAAGLAGLVAGPILVAIFPALTTRALPLLCAAPLLLLGWIYPRAPASRS